jgi:enoyl-CoA hydratase/carnithine racemase
MTEEVVTYELDGEIALVGLNRPEKRNSISDSLREGLAKALTGRLGLLGPGLRRIPLLL